MTKKSKIIIQVLILQEIKKAILKIEITMTISLMDFMNRGDFKNDNKQRI